MYINIMLRLSQPKADLKRRRWLGMHRRNLGDSLSGASSAILSRVVVDKALTLLATVFPSPKRRHWPSVISNVLSSSTVLSFKEEP